AIIKCPEKNDFIQLQMYTKPLEITEDNKNLHKRPRSVMQETVQSTSKLVVFGLDICANDNETGELAKDLLSIVIFQEGSNKTSSRQDEAINDLLKEYVSNIATKHKNFKMKFCSKKDLQQSIVILSKYWGKSCSIFSFFYKIESAESLLEQLGHDRHFVINRLGEFYLGISVELEKMS
ncbi:37517_t:CDS:2, partial [Gigaspora margarita]